MQTLTIYRQTQFQSTLPRGERLANAYETINRNRISIHAPTRGATVAIVAGEGEGTISIHAPTRGATIARDMVDFFFIRFQSTLPRGERRYGLDGYTVANVFQSTLPRGERHPALRSPPRISSFQSTLPRGERQLAELLDCVSKGNFNPRSHEGSDNNTAYIFVYRIISIHAPTRGATAIFAKKFSFLSAKIV